jgi:hypothetical protein
VTDATEITLHLDADIDNLHTKRISLNDI